MRIAVLGAGAIGSLVSGYLKLKGEDVSLIGRPEAVTAIGLNGLKISGVRGEFKVIVEAHDALTFNPDLLILATKSQDIDQALSNNINFLKSSIILTTQNGVRADDLVAKYVPKDKIISSIVMFGATYLEPGKIVHNFEGSWILGSMFDNGTDRSLIDISLVLDKAFPAVISQNIKGMKYLKIFVNANNCLPAILGISMQEAFADLNISRISIGIWKEGFNIIDTAGIELVSLPGFPVENITRLTALPPMEAAKIFSGIMSNLSRDPLYGSILQSIKRGRSSEIEYINGEFVTLADSLKINAPLNKRLVEMVRMVEKNNKFFSKQDLIAATQGLLND